MEGFDEIKRNETQDLAKKELKTIGKNLHSLREKGKLTLLDVAFYTFTNVTTVWKLEKGILCNVTICTLIKMCQLFNVTLADLLVKNDD